MENELEKQGELIDLAEERRKANGLTRREFEARLAEIRRLYGTTRATAGAKFEQAEADLIGRAATDGWTQEEIATAIGYGQQHVARLLNFAGFLAFTPVGVSGDLASLKHPLTERRFRSFWVQTKDLGGNERKRWQQTWLLLLAAEQDEAAGGRKKPRDFAPLRQALGKKFADGKWHDASKIAEHLEVEEEVLADIAASAAKFRLKDFPYELEEKPYGRSKRYRIFKTDQPLPRQRVLEELAPIAEALQEQGRKNGTTISIPTVARLAHQLKLLMQRWEDE